MHGLGIGALDEVRRIAVSLEQAAQLVMGDAREHGRVGDLVAVQVEDRQHRTVEHRIEELVRVPARRERAGLRLAVADHARDEQIGVVKRRAVSVHQAVAELAALVDRARGLGRDVTRDPAGERELAKQPSQALLVVTDGRIHLGVGALEVRVGHQPRPAVPRPGDIDDVQIALADDSIEMGVDEVQPGGRAPVPEQTRLDVLGTERLA